MHHVSDRVANPFGMRHPRLVDASAGDGRVAVVPGYGEPAADFHLLGDHPAVHGGRHSGVPFTAPDAVEYLQPVLHDAGLLASCSASAPDLDDLFASYRHASVTPDGRTPTRAEYADAERFLDAELRAVNAHVLLPVGERTVDHVLEAYTTRRAALLDDGEVPMAELHATEVRGRGFLVVPIRDPGALRAGDADALRERLRTIRARDYRQTKGVPTLVG